jgi:peptidoglycan/xylan/chitin deacetylase (PgdA/CDA1 family)
MKLVIYSSVSPDILRHLLWRLSLDLPEMPVCGVLYETARPPASTGKRVRRFAHLLRDREFLVYAVDRTRTAGTRAAGRLLDRALRFIHAAPLHPNGEPLSLDRVIAEWAPRGVQFHVTADCHNADSLAFVRQLSSDIGVIYGTRILKPALFTIPTRGSINIHKHKLPDYRGSGSPGLWELRDGRTEQAVTVHRVVEEVDAGAVLGERAFAIEPFDTLDSLQLKADIVGVDLIVDVLRQEAQRSIAGHPQPPGGELFKGIQPHRKHAILRRIQASRPWWRPAYFRPLWKQIPRVLALPLMSFRNHLRRRSGRFPVVVLYHHLICDRHKHMGLPTAVFARQIRYLKTHYRIVALADAVRMLQHGTVTAPTVVLTFDDGYADNFLGLRAIAELERVPVTIFVCPAHVGEQSELAHDINRGERGFRSMGWDEVRYLDRHGVTIGSHTRRHFNCGVDDRERLVEEIVGSREELERALGHPVEAFAFPKGKPQNISATAFSIARQAYPIVLSAAGGDNVGPMTFPAEIRRHGHPDSLIELELQLQGLLDRAVPLRPVKEIGTQTASERRPSNPTHAPAAPS